MSNDEQVYLSISLTLEEESICMNSFWCYYYATMFFSRIRPTRILVKIVIRLLTTLARCKKVSYQNASS